MINLLQYQEKLKVSQKESKKYIRCLIRNRDMVLQPEEMVRQLFLHYLVDDLGYSVKKIAVEKGLRVNNRMKRFDILIYDKKIDPYILVECKAPHIEIDQAVMDQIGQYNLPLGAKYLVLTNGKETIHCELSDDKKTYEYIRKLPNKISNK
ncbi:type I restriction enzyme HsdR N-terminal domain-containing protein [Saprospiraceae bacterium]|nr:type I restriction enzyme HsdR N-terminal domain-containing protein [Saprospiraceae bacterium]